jgi:hypothetical protein
MNDPVSRSVPGGEDGVAAVVPLRRRQKRASSTQGFPVALSLNNIADEDEDELVAVRDPNERRFGWRVTLGIVCALVAGVSIPMMVAVNPFSSVIGTASNEHLTRDGALGLLAATAGALTAWRPRWAAAMTGCCVAVLGLQLVGGVHDGHDNGVTVRFEAIHVAVLVIAGLVAFGERRRQYVPVPRQR